MSGKVINGRVKFFNTQKGYGFITGEDGLTYFVHYKEIFRPGFRKLKGGQIVTFEARESERGFVAKDVK